METSSRPRSGVLHNISFKWLEGAYQELHDQLEAQGELRYLDAVLHFVEGTAVNVGIRLGSQFVAISSAVFARLLGYQRRVRRQGRGRPRSREIDRALWGAGRSALPVVRSRDPTSSGPSSASGPSSPPALPSRASGARPSPARPPPARLDGAVNPTLMDDPRPVPPPVINPITPLDRSPHINRRHRVEGLLEEPVKRPRR
ncbi:hypothetical protein V8E54_004013 [Elaphomyces granulatus]